MGRLGFIGGLDRSKIVALDFASVEFSRQVHRLVAGVVGEPRLLDLPMLIQ